MKKILNIILMLCILFGLSTSVFAENEMLPSLNQNSNHTQTQQKQQETTSTTILDTAVEITGAQLKDGKLNIIFFHGDGCPHCAAEEKFFDEMNNTYPGKLNIIDFEVWYNETNEKYLRKVLKEEGLENNGIPFTIINDRYFVGFSDTTKPDMQKAIEAALDDNVILDPNALNLPIIGEVNVKNVSIPLAATVLGFVDGFNPCAMWVLLFLISMLLNMENKKRKWILGISFLFTSGLVYLLSMLGINIILSIISVSLIKFLISLVIFVFGILNIRKYFKTRKLDDGCVVVDKKKRKKLSKKINTITTQRNFWFALGGVIILAINVNLVELSCSLGFPVIFNEILTINNIGGIAKLLYMLIYIFFYMIDDMVVFTVSMFTLEATGITNKYNKLCTLISGIIMTIMGLLLILKPEWLMFNFN